MKIEIILKNERLKQLLNLIPYGRENAVKAEEAKDNEQTDT